MGVVMYQFWSGMLRMWGFLCSNLKPGRVKIWGFFCGSFKGGCYVAVLTWEAEDMGVVMWQV